MCILTVSHSQICNKEQLPQKFQSSLKAWYPFCNNTLDASGKNNHGLVSGTSFSALDRFNSPNSSWFFSGKNCESTMDAKIKEIDSIKNLTITLWIKRDGGGCVKPRIFEFWPNTEGPGQCYLYMRNGETKVGLEHRTSSDFLVSKEIDFGNDDWFFFSYTNDGKFARFYINCILMDSVPSKGNPVLANDVSFGRMNHPLFDAFNGRLDEIMILSKCCTGDELKELMGLCNNPEKPFNPLPDFVSACSNELILDAGTNYEGYLWNTKETSRTIRVVKNGQYSVRVSKGYGCDFVDTTTVALLSAKILQNDTTVCKGSNVRLSIDTTRFSDFTNSSLRPTIIWSTGETTRSINVSPLTSSSIFVSVQYDNIICNDTVQIGIIDPLNYNPFKDSIIACLGQKIKLNAGVGYGNYKWSTGSTGAMLDIDKSGKYSISVGNSEGCIGKDSVFIKFIDAKIKQKDTSLCLGQSYILSIDPLLGDVISPGNSKILWSNGAISSEILFLPSRTLNYSVLVTLDTLQCRDTVKVTVVDPAVVNAIVPKVSINSNSVEVCSGKSVSFTSIVSDAGPNPSYAWKVNGVSVSTDKTLQLNSLKQATSVKLEMISNLACATSKQFVSNIVNLNVIECDFSVFIPNSFTPNGDGVNDAFKVYGEYLSAELSIFNQWGELIFRGNGRNGWNGLHKGVLQPRGVYVYLVNIQLDNEEFKTKKGNINLIR